MLPEPRLRGADCLRGAPLCLLRRIPQECRSRVRGVLMQLALRGSCPLPVARCRGSCGRVDLAQEHVACTLGHVMLPILHFRPGYGSNGWSGGVQRGQFLAGEPVLAAKIWFQRRPDYGLSNSSQGGSPALRFPRVPA